jgi:hypothetical protein
MTTLFKAINFAPTASNREKFALQDREMTPFRHWFSARMGSGALAADPWYPALFAWSRP